MILRPHRPAGSSFVLGTAVATLLFASLAVAGDATPIDKASEQVSVALNVLKDVKVGRKDGDEHLEKARAYLVRARAELLKAQGQGSAE
ncbi:MAG: hypothetical protein K0R38_7609 [Polyangiaceae bacterium]|jgi:hypothetical protein|nr:hypothetical protein [Polyangiaceae bacterium]